MKRRTVTAITMLFAAQLWAASAWAETNSQVSRLLSLLRVSETIDIMQEEGMIYGAEIAEFMMPDADTLSWERAVARIYDPYRMRALVELGLTDTLRDQDIEPVLTFFESELGARIIDLELSARAAFLDQQTEDAAKELYGELVEDDDLIIGQIDALIEDSDLLEFNVMGILNSQLMFYRGLTDGGAYEMTEDDILRDVWAQEEGVREDSADWIGAYLLTSYQALESEELDQYVSFWRSEDGQVLNKALFAVFDQMYEELSYLLGQSVAQHMRSQKL